MVVVFRWADFGEMRINFSLYYNYISVYKHPNTGQFNATAQYLGCYSDDLMRDIAPTPTNTTIKSIVGCQDVCKGSNYFSLQDGLCFCGNKYASQARYNKLADSECGGTLGNSLGKPFRNAVLIIYLLFFNCFRFIDILIILA